MHYVFDYSYIPEYTTEEDEDPELDPTDVIDEVDVILLMEEFLVGGGGGAPTPLNGSGGKGPKFCKYLIRLDMTIRLR